MVFYINNQYLVNILSKIININQLKRIRQTRQNVSIKQQIKHITITTFLLPQHVEEVFMLEYRIRVESKFYVYNYRSRYEACYESLKRDFLSC